MRVSIAALLGTAAQAFVGPQPARVLAPALQAVPRDDAAKPLAALAPAAQLAAALSLGDDHDRCARGRVRCSVETVSTENDHRRSSLPTRLRQRRFAATSMAPTTTISATSGKKKAVKKAAPKRKAPAKRKAAPKRKRRPSARRRPRRPSLAVSFVGASSLICTRAGAEESGKKSSAEAGREEAHRRQAEGESRAEGQGAGAEARRREARAEGQGQAKAAPAPAPAKKSASPSSPPSRPRPGPDVGQDRREHRLQAEGRVGQAEGARGGRARYCS